MMGEAAANESSMEDILSSIRKIISEDETAKAGDDTTDTPSMAEATHEATDEVVSAPQADENEGKKSVSLADIAANIKAGVIAAPAKTDEQNVATPAVADKAPAPVAAAPMKAPEQAGDVNLSEKNGLKLSEIVAKMSSFKDGGSKPDSKQPEPAAKVEPVVEQKVDAVVDAAPDTVVQAPVAATPEVETPVKVEIKEAPLAKAEASNEADSFKSALMSPSSDDAVSGSFDRLKRSAMDDMDAKTEAILRPMLREWLDENLPTMVERLVREEIERVSRGV